MIYKSGDSNFKWAWLDLIGHDPVHPDLSVYKRITGDRNVFVYEEYEMPQYIISAKISNNLPRNMNDILNDDKVNDSEELYALFYSIFRVPGSTLKGGGGNVLRKVIDYCKMRNIHNHYTLSPVPYLKNNFQDIPIESDVIDFLNRKIDPVSKFHIDNGASVGFINYNADPSEIRQNESWCIMVNYCYNKHF